MNAPRRPDRTRHDGSFKGYGRGWRGRVRTDTCPTCSGAGGGPEQELLCPVCRGSCYVWVDRATGALVGIGA